MKRFLQKIPILGPVAHRIYVKWIDPSKAFSSSRDYWIERYKQGGNSGAGSYRQLAEFKAEILNKFVQENYITDIIEYGCGDGNQLRLAQYQSYIGFDVSPDAVSRCKAMFSEDSTKKFLLTDEYNGETAALTLCLDVIYHLVEDAVFDGYMHRLFDSSNKYVVIYSSNTDYNPPGQPDHVKHRKFTSWVEQNKPEWALHSFIPNRYPFTGDVQTGSFSDFYIYEKA